MTPQRLLPAVAWVLATSACVLMPTQPTVQLRRLETPLAGVRFALPITDLRTRGESMPREGSGDFDELRAYIVGQLNEAAGASPDAPRTLPTSVELVREDRPGDHELLRVQMQTVLPDGRTVDTNTFTRHRAPAREDGSGPGGLGPCGSPGGCGSCGSCGGLGGLGPLGLVFAAALAVVLVVVVVIGAIVLAVFLARELDYRADVRDAVVRAYSNLLQKTVARHVRRVQAALRPTERRTRTRPPVPPPAPPAPPPPPLDDDDLRLPDEVDPADPADEADDDLPASRPPGAGDPVDLPF